MLGFLSGWSVGLASAAQDDNTWRTLLEATGDLTGDGIAETVKIIEAEEDVTEPSNGCDGEDDYSDMPVRRLVVIDGTGDENAGWLLDDPRVILRRDQGGVFGDPLEDIQIENGTIVIRHYGGSRNRWGHTVRFRLENNQWLMTGMTEFQADSISNHLVEYDYNALSGRVKVTLEQSPDPMLSVDEPACIACRSGEGCPGERGCSAGTRYAETGEYWWEVGDTPRISIDAFACWREKVGLLRHAGFQSLR